MTDEIPTSVLFIGGRAGVGKSTVAAEMSRLLADADLAHAVIEGDTLDQAYPVPWQNGIDLAEMNLRAIWENYRRHGYHRMIYTNTASVTHMDGLLEALGCPAVGLGVLLEASDDTAQTRLAKRETGQLLIEHVERSRQAASALEQRAPIEVHRVGTDERDPSDVARELVELTGWSAQATPARMSPIPAEATPTTSDNPPA